MILFENLTFKNARTLNFSYSPYCYIILLMTICFLVACKWLLYLKTVPNVFWEFQNVHLLKLVTLSYCFPCNGC